MAHRRSRFGSSFLLVGATVLLAGCPVPASYDTATSAPVNGRILWDDGTPAREIPILLATGWARTPCGKVALRTTTDSAGAFALEATTEHHSVFWVVPNLDVGAPGFDLCAVVGDSVRHIYSGIGSLQASAQPASLSCTIMRAEGSAHASCNDQRRQNVVVGGRWGDSTGTGRRGLYRLLLTAQPVHVKGYRKNYKVNRPYVYVQWLEPIGAADSTAQRFRVDSTVSLPIDRDKVTDIGRVQLWRREGRWMVSMEGFKKSFMNDFDHAELIFALGGPGEAMKVSGP
ncbi:MAG TPA: hypothetical protein VF761_02130 [Gemmatimonadaceae bacterium]